MSVTVVLVLRKTNEIFIIQPVGNPYKWDQKSPKHQSHRIVTEQELATWGDNRSLQPQNLDNTGHLENLTIVVCLTFIMPASTSLPLPFTQEDDYFLWFQINQALSFTCQNWRNWCVGSSFQSQSCLSPLLGVVAGLWRMVRWMGFAIFLLDQMFTEKNWNGDMIRQRKWFRYQFFWFDRKIDILTQMRV